VRKFEGEIRGILKNTLDSLEKRKTTKTQSGQTVTRLKFDGGVGTEYISNNSSEKVSFAALATYLTDKFK
jgi:hypothetical protein